uniref:NADP-dependent oxidoreductase domain-containing protein n=1 Tax=Eutreptiella gymnastica TaxID=73025 RepID=A0A7S1ILP7_9EUGL
MPVLGFGTYCIKKEAVMDPLRWALQAGYRLIDTAWVYDNEKEIGVVLEEMQCRLKPIKTAPQCPVSMSKLIPVINPTPASFPFDVGPNPRTCSNPAR